MTDLAILGQPEDKQPALEIQNLAAEGLYVLVQRTLILLFTDKNDPINRGVGTSLPSELDSRNVTDLEVIRNLFNIALAAVKSTLQQTTPLDAPAEERIAEFSLEISEGERGEITADITVLSEAGTGTTVNVPVSNIREA